MALRIADNGIDPQVAHCSVYMLGSTWDHDDAKCSQEAGVYDTVSPGSSDEGNGRNGPPHVRPS
jgi:hypothetical protein